MTADWDEIKKLAADFQRTQLLNTVQKLSERNCIEIVRKLIKQNKLDVIFTSDGKEYLTPNHLATEIENELYANNGRIYLYELSSILMVDISLIEQKAVELTKNSHGRINLILGQLITNEYKDQLAIEINEKLQLKGTINIAEIIKFCDLPPDFIQNVINSRLQSIINGIQDPNNSQTYFTATYLDQFKSRIIGLLNGTTQPTTINQILGTFKFEFKIFSTIAKDLIKDNIIKGHFTSLTNSNGIFIPEVYSRIQNNYVQNFFKQNYYIEYDVLNRIGIIDTKNYFKKCDNLINLRTCLIDKTIYKRIESCIEETINEGHFVDLYSVSPVVFNEDDFKMLIDLFIKYRKKQDFILIFSYLISEKYLDKLTSKFNNLIKERAEQDLKNGLLINYFAEKKESKDKSDGSQLLKKKEERRKQNANKYKSGSGTQGREVKIKAIKKKNKKKDNFEDDYDFCEQSSQNTLKFMTLNEISQKLSEFCERQDDLSGKLLEKISEILEPILNNSYYNVAKDVYISSQTMSGLMVKKTHSELQNTTQHLYQNIFMFNKALTHVKGDLQIQLKKYLCKTLCTELINNLINYSLSNDENNLSTTESRAKVIKRLNQNIVEPFLQLNQSISLNNVEQLLQDAENLFEKLDLMIRKVDKRQENIILLENKHNLLKQLEEVNENHALILHLSVIILFNEAYKTMLHASGKFVPQLIDQLKIKLDSITFNLLFDCEKLIVQLFRNEHNQESVGKSTELIAQVKNVATILPKTIFITD